MSFILQPPGPAFAIGSLALRAMAEFESLDLDSWIAKPQEIFKTLAQPAACNEAATTPRSFPLQTG